jgi:hypothetical protein
MAGQFLVSRGDRETFCSEDELRGMAARGQLQPGDLVYHPVLGRWLYAKEVEEVRQQIIDQRSLGQPEPEAPQPNAEAMLGFILGVLGHLPLVGVACCLLGIYFSGQGLRRAAAIKNAGLGLAMAGMVLSVVFLVPAAFCGALFWALAFQPAF